MSTKPLTVPVKILSQSILSTDMSFVPNNIVGWDGNDITSANLGTQAFGALLSADRTVMELFEYDPATIASASIAFLKRGLSFDGLQTEVLANKRDWTANETYILIGTDTPQFMQQLAALGNDNVFTGANSFSQLPTSTGGNATNDTQLVTYAQVVGMVTGNTPANKIVVSGKAGETVAAGNILYLKAADNRWWKASSAVASTSENVILGIAQGAGTAGNTITSGVLIRGVDTNQTGLTIDTVYYLSTGGSVSISAGTKSVIIGATLSATSILFNPNYNLQLTKDQQNAARGTSGTPSLTNPYITENDSSTGAVKTATTISFTASTKTISDSGSGFITANFRAGESIIVTGSASNNSTYTIESVAAGAIVVAETLVDEASGATVTITTATINKLVRFTQGGILPNNINTAAYTTLTAAESITAGAPVSAGFYQSDGGIQLDTQDKATVSTSTSITKSFTVGNNTNRILIVNVQAGSAITANSATFNGVAMTAIPTASFYVAATSDGNQMFYLLAPDVTTANVVVNFSGSTNAAISIHSYYNVAQTSTLNATAKISTSGTTATLTQTITPTVPGCLIFVAGTLLSSGSPSTWTTPPVQHASTNAISSQTAAIAGDNGFIVPEILTSITIVGTQTTGGNAFMGLVALKPVTAPVYNYVVNASSEAIASYSPLTTFLYRLRFIGFATSSVTVGQSLSIQTAGVLITSALTQFRDYYLADTPGTIGTSAGTNSRKVGVAMSATKLFITNIW